MGIKINCCAIVLLLFCMVSENTGIFASSDELILIQKAIHEQQASWQAAENEISRLPDESRRLLCKGRIPDLHSILNHQPSTRLSPAGPERDYLDWRNYLGSNWITEVKNQGGCGSCAAFSAAGAFEAVIRLAYNDPERPVDLSEQHLFSCSGGDCPTGLYIGDALDYALEYGVPDEACFPYTASDDNCDETCMDWKDRALRLDSWEYVCMTVTNEQAIKDALLISPVTSYLEVYQDFFSYDGGVYEYVWGSFAGGHFVDIIGYDDALDCWICKNSWDKTWGEEGFFRILRGTTMIGTYVALLSYTAPEPPTPGPTLTPTPSYTSTPVAVSPTPSPSCTSTAVQSTPTPSASLTATPNSSATAQFTSSPVPSATPSRTSSPVPSTTPSCTVSPAPSTTGIPSPSATPVTTETATPIPEVSPSVTPIIPGIQCYLNSSHFQPGSSFHLSAIMCNSESNDIVREVFIVLECQNLFFFWPEWESSVGYEFRTIDRNSCITEDPVLDFPWPHGCGSANGLRFWAVLIDPVTSLQYGSYSTCEFSYGE